MAVMSRCYNCGEYASVSGAKHLCTNCSDQKYNDRLESLIKEILVEDDLKQTIKNLLKYIDDKTKGPILFG